MYKRILVPIDGSTPSNAALLEALRFAGEGGSALRLIHVCESLAYVLAEGPVDLAATVRQEGERLLQAAEAKAREAGVTVERAVIDAGERRVAAVIAEEAGRADCELIIMGTHGRRGFEHLVLGSVAEGVIRRAAVPVLLVHSR